MVITYVWSNTHYWSNPLPIVLKNHWWFAQVLAKLLTSKLARSWSSLFSVKGRIEQLLLVVTPWKPQIRPLTMVAFSFSIFDREANITLFHLWTSLALDSKVIGWWRHPLTVLHRWSISSHPRFLQPKWRYWKVYHVSIMEALTYVWHVIKLGYIALQCQTWQATERSLSKNHRQTL